MLPEKWKIIKGNVKDNFKVEDEGNIHLDEEGGIDIEFIVFYGPLGKMRMEYISKPIVIDKKTTYSRRIGSETNVTYVFSDKEKSNTLKVYKWDNNEDVWEEIDAKNFTG
jgi:hypothetical protein